MFSSPVRLMMFFLVVGAVMFIAGPAIAATGGSEVSGMWTDVSNGLAGGWGKLLAVLMIGGAVVAFKQGAIIPGFSAFVLGLSIGTIPAIINSKYSILF